MKSKHKKQVQDMEALLVKPGLQALLVSSRQESVAPSELLLLTEVPGPAAPAWGLLDMQGPARSCAGGIRLLTRSQVTGTHSVTPGAHILITLRSYPVLKAEPLDLCPAWPRLVGPLPGLAA